MRVATKFSRWFDRTGAHLPEHIRALAETARCALNQMAMDPRSNELCPQLRAANLADIHAFAVAYAEEKSRADSLCGNMGRDKEIPAPRGFQGQENEVTNHPNRKKDADIAVVVTTEHRGVFFGYVPEGKAKETTIDLRAARNCVYWSSDVRGFMGLASAGPSKSCKVGPAADITLHKVTSVMKCTPTAAQAWEAAPWTR